MFLPLCECVCVRERETLTGYRPEDIWYEYLHQDLVHEVVAGTHPLQHALVPAEQQQLGPRQTALNLTHRTV